MEKIINKFVYFIKKVVYSFRKKIFFKEVVRPPTIALTCEVHQVKPPSHLLLFIYNIYILNTKCNIFKQQHLDPSEKKRVRH